MPLAYVFWHAPAGDADLAAYEQRMHDFHAALGVPGSRTFRLERGPYDAAPPRLYEDWYPVADWAGLGTLNERAVSGARRPPHDAVAVHAIHGAGAVYGLLQGDPAAPIAEARWLAKPAGMPYALFHEELAATVPDATVWQRQMVLGPAPEYAVLTTGPIALPWRSVATGPQPI